jgi:hypothetical protein
MDMSLVASPLTSPLEYLIVRHGDTSKWKTSFGTILNVDILPDGLRVRFSGTREQASRTDRWDETSESAIVEVLGADGRTVFETLLYFDDNEVLTRTLCLQEK